MGALKKTNSSNFNERYGDTSNRKPFRRSGLVDEVDFDSNPSCGSIVAIGNTEQPISAREREKLIMLENLNVARERQRPPNVPAKIHEHYEGYQIGSDSGSKTSTVEQRLRYKELLDADIAGMNDELIRQKSAYFDPQRAGVVYSMSCDPDPTDKLHKQQQYKQDLDSQARMKEERRRTEKEFELGAGWADRQKLLNTSRYYG